MHANAHALGDALQGRESIAAKLTANILTEAGADRVLAMDLHSGQCVGYFDIPVDHVYGDSVMLDYLASKRISTGDLVVVSPDVGGVARARAFAKKLNDAPLAIVDKRRSAHNVSEVMNLIGDVRGKVAVLVDDMIDTAGTITNAAKVLHAEGAREVYACATHAVFSPPAVERLSSGVFQEVIVTNTIECESSGCLFRAASALERPPIPQAKDRQLPLLPACSATRAAVPGPHSLERWRTVGRGNLQSVLRQLGAEHPRMICPPVLGAEICCLVCVQLCRISPFFRPAPCLRLRRRHLAPSAADLIFQPLH